MAPQQSVIELSERLDRWVAERLISETERAAILRYEAGARPADAPAPVVEVPTARGRRVPGVAEALGYLGAVLAVVGLGLILGRYWPDMATAGRLLLSGFAAVALLGAGALTQERTDPALARLRWFLWLAATAATAVFAGVLVHDGLEAAPESVVLACAASVTALSGLLWQGQGRPVQELTFLTGVAVSAGALVAQVASGAPVGLVVWAVGVSFVALGLTRRLELPALADGVGALAAVVGAQIVAADWTGPGFLLVVASAGALLALAVVPGLAPQPSDQRVLGLLGGITLLQAGPATVGWFSQDAAGPTGLVAWAAGGLLVTAGIGHRVRLPVAAQVLGGAALVGGAALTGIQWAWFAPVFGIATGVAMLALGARPGRVLLSVISSAGLLVNVPWAIAHFFPGEGRAPVLVMASGALFIALAVVLARRAGRPHPA